ERVAAPMARTRLAARVMNGARFRARMTERPRSAAAVKLAAIIAEYECRPVIVALVIFIVGKDRHIGHCYAALKGKQRPIDETLIFVPSGQAPVVAAFLHVDRAAERHSHLDRKFCSRTPAQIRVLSDI